MDGTILDAPDYEAHQHLERSSGSRGKGAFPQVRKISLVATASTLARSNERCRAGTSAAPSIASYHR